MGRIAPIARIGAAVLSAAQGRRSAAERSEGQQKGDCLESGHVERLASKGRRSCIRFEETGPRPRRA